MPTKTKDGSGTPKKTKSATNLAAVFAKMNRSSKDLSKQVQQNKENTAPLTAADKPLETPIWAQFASENSSLRPSSKSSSRSANNVQDEIARYTPQNYSPSKQRNFNGSLDQPSARPTLGRDRPKSAYFSGEDGIFASFGRKVSSRPSIDERRRSEDTKSKEIPVQRGTVSQERSRLQQRKDAERKTSGSSTEQVPVKEKLNITKRGGRVMAAVAAFQSKSKGSPTEEKKEETPLDPKTVDAQFEAVLESRNVPEPMRQKMRTLTLRVKADFVKQDKGTSPPGTVQGSLPKSKSTTILSEIEVDTKKEDDDSKSTKRSRTRSRGFTFSKGDKKDKGEESPSKKKRSESKSRPTSIHIPKEVASRDASAPTTPTGSFGRKNAPPAVPRDYIDYLRQNQDPTKVEVGRLHKLRILLRNETVAWVDSFISQDGMSEIVGLVHRIMAIEWREEHEDQLLHESLLCLKGLCTTERALAELGKVADSLFPALLGMLFDDEKKGPAEYTTRTVIINVLFNFLAAATGNSPSELEERARQILTYLGEPPKPEDARPADFVLAMRTPRPYKLWSREVSNVTKEVFWIFLHHLNIVPLPKPRSSQSQTGESEEERVKTLQATYTQRHFPGSRPPVPAAPYIGGVEWDATTYLTAHLDLLNGLIASVPSAVARNDLRRELQASGFEKTMGAVLRTCKEKFYSGVHDGLRAWVAAAAEDGWETRFVREGPTEEEVKEQAVRARSASPKKNRKKDDEAPKLDGPVLLEAPKLDLDLGVSSKKKSSTAKEDDGWLG